jgi:uncharacterized protein (TIRG00374 family)
LDIVRLEPLIVLAGKPILLVMLILLAWLTYPICTLRWHLLLKIQAVHPSFIQVLRVLYLSAFLGLVLPGVVGGDAVRIGLGIPLSPKQKTEMALSVLVDRLTGVFGLLTLGIGALLLFLDRASGNPEIKALMFYIAGTFLGFCLAIAVAGYFSRRLREIGRRDKWERRSFPWRLAAKLIEATALYRDSPGRLAVCWGLSILVHGKNLILLVILAVAMGMGGLGVLPCALAGTVTFLANFLPLTPGGLGIGEAAFAQTISWLVPAAVPLAYGSVILVYRAVTLVSLLPAPLMTPRQIWVRR